MDNIDVLGCSERSVRWRSDVRIDVGVHESSSLCRFIKGRDTERRIDYSSLRARTSSYADDSDVLSYENLYSLANRSQQLKLLSPLRDE